ncbi:MAG TPA: hypothetical protein PKA12_05060 [Saprospiraceae bacterium]|nr:hypothetical protein [Saprospiraceae bacterium]
MADINDQVNALLQSNEHLRALQAQMFETMNILIENQKVKSTADNIVIQNQGNIIRNQEVIVKNQVNIINNQKLIVENQVTLSVLVKLQAVVLNKINALGGNQESIEETMQSIEKLKTAWSSERPDAHVQEADHLK